MTGVIHSAEPDRVRANTWGSVNERLDGEAQLRLRRLAASSSRQPLEQRLDELDREWDFDRVLETEASLMGLVGLILGMTIDRRLLILPAVVSSMLILHASHGWYPLLPLFRRAGVRSRDEIDRERYGLKALRGDFEILPAGADAAQRAAAAWKAVCE